MENNESIKKTTKKKAPTKAKSKADLTKPETAEQRPFGADVVRDYMTPVDYLPDTPPNSDCDADDLEDVFMTLRGSITHEARKRAPLVLPRLDDPKSVRIDARTLARMVTSHGIVRVIEPPKNPYGITIPQPGLSHEVYIDFTGIRTIIEELAEQASTDTGKKPDVEYSEFAGTLKFSIAEKAYYYRRTPKTKSMAKLKLSRRRVVVSGMVQNLINIGANRLPVEDREDFRYRNCQILATFAVIKYIVDRCDTLGLLKPTYTQKTLASFCASVLHEIYGDTEYLTAYSNLHGKAYHVTRGGSMKVIDHL